MFGKIIDKIMLKSLLENPDIRLNEYLVRYREGQFGVISSGEEFWLTDVKANATRSLAQFSGKEFYYGNGSYVLLGTKDRVEFGGAKGAELVTESLNRLSLSDSKSKGSVEYLAFLEIGTGIIILTLRLLMSGENYYDYEIYFAGKDGVFEIARGLEPVNILVEHRTRVLWGGATSDAGVRLLSSSWRANNIEIFKHTGNIDFAVGDRISLNSLGGSRYSFGVLDKAGHKELLTFDVEDYGG